MRADVYSCEGGRRQADDSNGARDPRAPVARAWYASVARLEDCPQVPVAMTLTMLGIRLPHRLAASRGAIASLWRCLLFVAAWGCLARATAQAQRSPLARIQGLVTDSVHGTALSGALVLLARRSADTAVSRSTTTDADGRFSFDGLPSGEYVVALESPFLDSLELASPVRTGTATPGTDTHVTLAIPSGATLRTLVCSAAFLPPGVGALRGRVRDAVTERPLGAALLSIRWTVTSVDRTTLRAKNTEQGVDVRTDSLGQFLVCGVPTDTYLDVGATVKGYKDVLLQLNVQDGAGVARQDVLLSPAESAVEVLGTADSTSATARTVAASAVGVVMGAVFGTSAPLSRAQVQVRGDSVAVSTDSLGRYRLATVPLGTQVMEIRRVGYLPREVTVEVQPGRNTAPDLYLTPIATLDSIRVVAQRIRYREFETRARAAGFGHFLRADDIAKKKPLLTSDLVRQLPGFRIVRPSTSDLDVEVIESRGDLTSLHDPGKVCYANIVIDGVPGQKINWIDPQSIGAMEIYAGPAGAPPQYQTSTGGPMQSQSGCGTILLWTKRP